MWLWWYQCHVNSFQIFILFFSWNKNPKLKSNWNLKERKFPIWGNDWTLSPFDDNLIKNLNRRKNECMNEHFSRFIHHYFFCFIPFLLINDSILYSSNIKKNLRNICRCFFSCLVLSCFIGICLFFFPYDKTIFESTFFSPEKQQQPKYSIQHTGN